MILICVCMVVWLPVYMCICLHFFVVLIVSVCVSTGLQWKQCWCCCLFLDWHGCVASWCLSQLSWPTSSSSSTPCRYTCTPTHTHTHIDTHLVFLELKSWNISNIQIIIYNYKKQTNRRTTFSICCSWKWSFVPLTEKFQNFYKDKK